VLLPSYLGVPAWVARPKIKYPVRSAASIYNTVLLTCLPTWLLWGVAASMSNKPWLQAAPRLSSFPATSLLPLIEGRRSSTTPTSCSVEAVGRCWCDHSIGSNPVSSVVMLLSSCMVGLVSHFILHPA